MCQRVNVLQRVRFEQDKVLPPKLQHLIILHFSRRAMCRSDFHGSTAGYEGPICGVDICLLGGTEKARGHGIRVQHK